MTSIRDKVRKSIETASAPKETASVDKLLQEAKSKISKMSKNDAQKLLAKAVEWFMWEDDDSGVVAAQKGGPKKIAAYIVDADPVLSDDGVIAFLVDNKILAEKDTRLSIKEKASTKEVAAKKHKSTAKMVSKISAIIQAMGMDAGQWDAVSKQVFKKAFGGKREKANVEKASGPKNTNEFCNTLGHDLERLNTKVKAMAKNPRKTDAMFVADELEGMADFARSGIAVFK